MCDALSRSLYVNCLTGKDFEPLLIGTHFEKQFYQSKNNKEVHTISIRSDICKVCIRRDALLSGCVS